MPVTAYKKTTPRVAPSPMTLDPKMQIAVGEKGGVSVYGLGRFPVTLFGEQWERLLAVGDEIREYILANADQLATKESVASEPVEDRTFTLGGAEIALLAAEEKRLLAEGDNSPEHLAKVVKIATIKSMGINRHKVSFDELAVVQQLKARK